MIKGKTQTGFKFKINEKALNDMRMLELVGQIENDEVWALSPFLEKLLGKAQKDALYRHVENKYGQVPIDALSNEVRSMMIAIPALKN